MKTPRPISNESLFRLKNLLNENFLTDKFSSEEPPLRSELFSADQMEQHGILLAKSHELNSQLTPGKYLLSRLAENEIFLNEVHNLLIDAAKTSNQVTPAGEWLLDNFYLIEEQIHTGKRHLPKGYIQELPSLQNGPSKGLPRVYEIALEIISHGDGRVDPENLNRFVTAYQTIANLKLGELWAIPTMLRLALIENLRRVSVRVAAGRIERDLADTWADLMIETAGKDPKNLILVIADMVRTDPPMTTPFVSEFTRRLQGLSIGQISPLAWIEQRLSESGLTIAKVIQSGNKQQAADQVSISNSIGSLRFLNSTNWSDFVESISTVEQTLSKDPANVYSKMDFATRDIYRHRIEKIAKNSSQSEYNVAQLAIQLAQESAADKGDKDRTAHVGYYLIDDGLKKLEKIAKVRFSVFSLLKLGKRASLFFYITSVILLTSFFTIGIYTKTSAGGLPGWQLVILGILLFLGTSQLAVTLVNWISTLLAMPKALPRMDFSKGIPTELSTLVVIPAILTDDKNIKELIESLEVRFLANQEENLHFGLLTDFKDSVKEFQPEDESLLLLANNKIEELNEKYQGLNNDIFFLFHRPRQWNPKQQKWMGYERKRGKLLDLNTLLRGGSEEKFSLITGKTEILPNIKYIITLDTDTQLPRDSARQLIGVMAHPLNQGYYDETKQRVTDGYAILQPRVAVSLPGTNRSRYARLYGSQPGIDPYTRTVSDVYQDVFGEGSFIGKGIYDVDVFMQALEDRFPDNLILSHDLLEGSYAKSGLLSDVLLFEEYPSHYNADVNRRHRWIRGDWQLIQWLLPIVPGPTGRFEKNPLSILSRWKLLDNLRRSLVPAALTLLLLSSWILLPLSWIWTISVAGIILIPTVIISILDLFKKHTDMLLRQHITGTLRSSGMNIGQALFTLITLPYESYYSLDAILRTLWRMIISRKNLLEWNPANFKRNNRRINLPGSYLTMWVSPVISISVAAWFLTLNLSVPFAAIPILFLWLIAPAVTWWISLPLIRQKARITADQKLFLQKLSRKTWSFFETFVGPDDNWLPPDNYQENPVPVIAHRTSPTNMGLSLLANLSAFDFGYITTGQFIERTSNTLKTMESLIKYHGHFYNWYNTQTLNPLYPLYISSVDSGNLATHLLTLRQGILELPDHKIPGPQLFSGINDTLGVLTEIAEGSNQNMIRHLQNELDLIINSPSASLKNIWQNLNLLVSSSKTFADNCSEITEKRMGWWANALAEQCKSSLDELNLLIPWLQLNVPESIAAYFPAFDSILSLRELANINPDLLPLNQIPPEIITSEKKHIEELQKVIFKAVNEANERITTINCLANQTDLLSKMEYNFLYDRKRHLLSVGYNIEDKRRDASYYDLLASESRTSNFVAIAQGELPQESWFALGRLLTSVSGEPILLSWSGSMFEYLMPLLVMPTYENTILDQTYKSAVRKQIEYGKQSGVPWGISESCYNTVDVNLNYQYRAFGVPGLGLKRGLSRDLVIAPYASALALMVEPEEACSNLQLLASEGLMGQYGFYEAVDYTASRMPRDQTKVIIKSFMAHHEGMSLLSLAYLLLDRPMQKRFEADPLFEATILLLQERIPKTSFYYRHTSGHFDSETTSSSPEMPVRIIKNPDTAIPEVQLMSNGRYNVMITNAGGGYSRWKDVALTRWQEDSTCDNRGTFCYIRDLDSGEFWSAAHQPSLKKSRTYESVFSEGHAGFRRQDNNFDTYTEIVISPEDDIELRRVHLTNRSKVKKEIEITSYAEVVLASAASDALHPAFSKLFVQTEILPERQAILCTRRPRSPEEQALWMFHMMAVRGANVKDVSFETDRVQFIGRGNTLESPRVMKDKTALSNTEGSVLDPIVAIRYHIVLEPDETVNIDMIYGISETRYTTLGLIDKYQDRRLTNRVFELAWTHSQVVLRQINATEADAQLFGHIANSIIYANSFLRADQSIIMRNLRGQSGLWGYSISGDLPIVLLQIEDITNINLVRQMVQAHTYWRLKGLTVDLVIWNEDHAGYRQQLQEQIMRLIAAGIESNNVDRPGGIFVRQADQISNEDRTLIQTVARIIISDKRGTLEAQIKNRSIIGIPVPYFKATKSKHIQLKVNTNPASENLIFYNGYGGFTTDGHEYVINTSDKQVTPAPWVNVIANENFGTVVSENGPSYTWSENAHEFRLTPWNNDPVCDSSGEAFYIRDEETGSFWSPSPMPVGGIGNYTSRHGFGYSIFEHIEDGIKTELCIYVALDESVKFSVLKIHNMSGKIRKLSATGYVELVLGDLRSKTAAHIITEIDPDSEAILVRNSYNTEFPERIVFLQAENTGSTYTCNRTEFIGRNGTLKNPAVMSKSNLSGRTGAAFDPCAAIQIPIELNIGQEREIIFKFGVGRNHNETKNILQRFQGPDAAKKVLTSVHDHWKHTLAAVQVDTPDVSLNVLTNGWLLYQTIACRIWARSGYYQSGGAFGFRDQLQDSLALIHTTPELLRKQLLLCASRQFLEGDVQHWWHPPSGRGVRTHCSDDYLWLPLAVSRYVINTGDNEVLDESINYLEGRAVKAEDDSYYDLPNRSAVSGSLYQHCKQAILHGLNFGEHGLPLIGTGDWNDGMNMVGMLGKGESIWLGFFLYDVLIQFSKIADSRGDSSFVVHCHGEATELRKNIEKHGWDGEWYLRAYFDDGTKLGSAGNQECRIDSIVQSWSVLSNAGDLVRSRKAMNALDKYLVRRDHSLIQLLDPPFDKSEMNPGYIKGYVPGVRENGGQYTHAAIWAAMAFAESGDSKRAWELMNIINPINHAKSKKEADIYKVEPYVIAADIYAVAPHTGRGGWTWYTGSAGWMYRFIIESLLGLKLEADKLIIEPCLPADWEKYTVNYRFRETTYNITIIQLQDDNGDTGITVDGIKHPGKVIHLADDRKEHIVEMKIIKAQPG